MAIIIGAYKAIIITLFIIGAYHIIGAYKAMIITLFISNCHWCIDMAIIIGAYKAIIITLFIIGAYHTIGAYKAMIITSSHHHIITSSHYHIITSSHYLACVSGFDVMMRKISCPFYPFYAYNRQYHYDNGTQHPCALIAHSTHVPLWHTAPTCPYGTQHPRAQAAWQ